MRLSRPRVINIEVIKLNTTPTINVIANPIISPVPNIQSTAAPNNVVMFESIIAEYDFLKPCGNIVFSHDFPGLL